MHAIRVSRMGFHRRSLFAAARAITTPANAISSRSIALHMEAFDRSRRCFSTWRSSSFPNGDSSYSIDGTKLGDNRPIRSMRGGRCIHLIPGGEYKNKIIDHARWAVNVYNMDHKTSLKFIKVNYVTQQVVSGLMYYITLEAADGCLIKVYEAKVWEQIWLNSKELVKFTQIR